MIDMIQRGEYIVPDKMDGKVIPAYLAGLQGGANLDITGYPLDYIYAGTLVIKETATGVFKPMPAVPDGDGMKFSTLPVGCEYVGVVVNTREKEYPLVGVMTQGVVLAAASFIKYTPELLTELKTALKIEFR